MFIRLQNKILEMIAMGVAAEETLAHLCGEVERQTDDVACSILSINPQGRIRHLAGPSIPETYSSAINGLYIGEGVGSCGTAAARKEQVLVSDIENDPLWAPFKHLALAHGFRGCWSIPILSKNIVVGTFAFYFRRVRKPTRNERNIVTACTHLCAIAMEREAKQEESDRLAYMDTLTGLYNRAKFNDTYSETAKNHDDYGLLLLDLDNLKMVNDSYGHRAGDALLRSVAIRLTEIFEKEQIFRLGGDEFAIFFTNQADNDLEIHARAILSALKTPCLCDGHSVLPSATIGGAKAGAGLSAQQVLRNADLALYDGKERFRGQYHAFDHATHYSISNRYRTVQMVTKALQEQRLRAFYQPIVLMKTREIIGFESLCRIENADGSLSTAASFHAATQDATLAKAITDFMLHQVATDMAEWRRMGLNIGKFGLNVGEADFADGQLPERLLNIIHAAGAKPQWFVLEINESVYLHQIADKITMQIRQLRSHGMSIALDDFGTGFASLTHLLTMPVDIIKIDRSFTNRMLSDCAARIIIEGVTNMAVRLGYRVTAEGIETEEQFHATQKSGCVCGQGYLFSKPLSREETLHLLKTEVHRIHHDETEVIRENRIFTACNVQN